MKGFVFRKRIPYYETDAMGVVHHSNYIRHFEECRVAWYNHHNLDKLEWSSDEKAVMAVLHVESSFRAPARFNEHIEITMQIRKEGKSRILFRYATYNQETKKLLCTGSTLHIPVNADLKVVRLHEKIAEIIEEEPWTEIWP